MGSKNVLAMLASLALTATLEVGYFVYLKNTITPTLPIKDAKLDLGIFNAVFAVLLLKVA